MSMHGGNTEALVRRLSRSDPTSFPKTKKVFRHNKGRKSVNGIKLSTAEPPGSYMQVEDLYLHSASTQMLSVCHLNPIHMCYN